jgi:hypothetical protein
MNKTAGIFAAMMMAVLACPAVAADGTKDVTLSLGYNYSRGDYGQTSDTSVYYAPATVKYKHGEWAAKLVIPYIRITGPGVVVGDVPVGTPRPSGTESGLGDVLASGTWTHRLNAQATMLELAGIAKLPTADEDKRLGTGLFDFTAQAGLIQPVGKAYFMGNAGRKFNGDNKTFPLRDAWKTTLGAGYNFTPAFSAGVIYDWRGKQSATSDPLSLATGYVSYNFGEGVTAQVYASAGFTDSSPDCAIGIQLNRDFDLF